MGMFSWRTSDTNKTLIASFISARNIGRPTARLATLLHPNGVDKFKGSYDGYGNLVNTKGQSIFILGAVNAPSIKEYLETPNYYDDNAFLNFEKTQGLVKLVEKQRFCFEDLPPSLDCPTQGFMYE